MTNDPVSSSRLYHVITELDRRIIPIVMIVGMLLMFDFVSRLNESNAETKQETLVVERALSKAVILSAGLHEGYVNKLETLGGALASSDKESPPIAPEGDILLTAKQLAWQVDNLDYSLLAVFGGKKEFAVLVRVNRLTAAREVIELAVGDSVSEYKLTEISPSGIVLVNASGDIVNLLLFRPAGQDVN
jgi:hypothetical protein